MKASLNHIFRSIWSEALNTWVAVSELTSAKGKRSGSCVLNAALSDSAIYTGSSAWRNRELRLKPIFIALACCYSLSAQANPIGAQVVNGQASFATTGNALTVTNTPGAIINWQGFSIGANEITRFNQQSAASAVLNRVVSNNPSSILGALQSNGRVFLINPKGIVFGQGATVDVAGLVASTLNLSNADFLAGRYHFTQVPGAQNISNAGNIAAQSGGQIYLIAPNVENTGVIAAPNGEILLAAGHSVDLVSTSNPNLRVNITAPAGDATNIGQLIASSGSLGLFGTVVKNSGSVNADSATLQGGRIVFKASQRVEAGGTISASGAGGGNIAVLADMQSGTVNVTGTLDASAPNSGNGGFIETSAAHVNIADTARVTTAAAMGLAGTWLIDPFDYTIAATGGNMSGATLTASLTAGNVIIASTSGTTGTLGDVNVNDAVSWSANKLALNAFNNININANLNGSGSASLALVYGQGAVALNNTSNIITKGAAVNLPAGTTNFTTLQGSNGVVKNYTVITALGAAGSVTATDLQGMSGGRALNYALGGNIDATATSAWNAGAGFVPVGDTTTPFTGAFEGLGHTITNLTINRPAATYVGLFGYTIGANIRNVGLIGGSVTGGGGTYAGGLVGYNVGTIINSYATGTVNGANYVGGLAGYNWSGGTISNSYSTGNVSGTGGRVGGLVGYNNGGAISNSYSTGTVTGTADVGGLVGDNSGAISNSYSTGNVTGSVSGNMLYLGGLVGGNYGTITNSYSTGNVSGTGNPVGGLVGENGGTITNSYSTGAVSGTGNAVGGLVGYKWNAGTITNSYWDTQTSGQVNCVGFGSSAGCTGLTTAGMMAQASFAGFDFTSGTPVWWMSEGNTRPFLRSEYSTTITNAHQLQLMGMNAAALAASYTLGANINMAELSQASGMWNTATGFSPIGNSTTQFTGAFEGLGHTITNLTINRPVTNNVGLFGYTGAGSTLKNVGLVGGSVSGAAQGGGLTGVNGGTITNSYSTGAVSGTINVGGLAGYNAGTGIITNSYATGAVSGSAGGGDVGGLAGSNFGTITNSYSTGSVTGSSNVGGLVGWNTGAITSSYWDTQTSGQAASAGGTGLTTAQMKQSGNLTGFDFTNVWNIVPGISYPYLQWQFSGTPQVLSGTASGLAGGKTIQFIANGANLAQASTGANGFYYLALPGNSVPSGNTLVTYVAGDAYKGAAAYGSSGSHATGLAISQNTLTVSGGNVSNSGLGTAKGLLTSPDIPYSVTGGNLMVSSGLAFQTLAGTNYTLDGNVITTGNQNYSGTLTLPGSATLHAQGSVSDLILAGTITGTGAANSNLFLRADRSIVFNTGANLTSTNALNVVLNSDSDGLNGGAISMASGSSITSNGGNITLGGGVAGNGTGNAVGTALNHEGILLDGATLNAGAGNISLRGTGFAGTTFNDGIYATNGSVIRTTGVGAITLNGTGGAGTTDNYGVRLGTNSAMSSVDGAISIAGQGGAGTGSWNIGVYVHNNATITSTGAATLTLNGTGGAGTSSNYGVRLSSGMQISSVNGDISITGQGAGTGTSNYGIRHTNTSGAIASTGAANITLDGRGAGSAGINTAGVIHGSPSTGNVTLIADTVGGAGSIVLSGATISGAGALLLEPLNPATSIELARGCCIVAGAFNLSSAELNTIQPGFASLTIGRANGTGLITFGDGAGAGTGYTFNANTVIQNPGSASGIIDITDPINAGLHSLTLNSGSTIRSSATAFTGLGGTLRLIAGADVQMNGDLNTTVTGLSAAQNAVDIRGVGQFIFSGSGGVSANSGSISIVSSGTTGVELDNGDWGTIAYRALAGDVTISSNGGLRALGGANISGQNVTLSTMGVMDIYGYDGGNITATGTATISAGADLTNAAVPSKRLGSITANSLNVAATGGIALDTTVANLTTSNTGAGNTLINNTGALTVNGMSDSLGSLTLNNAGSVTLGSWVSANAITFNVNGAASDLTLPASGGSLNATTDMVVNVGHNLHTISRDLSAGGNQTLNVGNDLFIEMVSGSPWVSANGTFQNITVGHDLLLQATTSSGIAPRIYALGTNTKQTISVGNDMTINSLQDKARIRANGDQVITVGRNLTLNAAAGYAQITSYNGAQTFNVTGNLSLLAVGDSAYFSAPLGQTLNVGGNLVLQGGTASWNNAYIGGGGPVSGRVDGNVMATGTASLLGTPDIGSAASPFAVGGTISMSDGAGGGAGSGAQILSGAANSIWIYFPNLASGGYTVNGAQAVSNGASGFYANATLGQATPAVLNGNLHITYGLTVPAAPAPAAPAPAAPAPAAPAPAPINSVGFMADLVNTMLIPGGGASGSSQSPVGNKKPPATVVAVNGEILLAGSNEQPLPVCR